jgi:hypothetical protein
MSYKSHCDVDRSAYYNHNGQKYQVSLETGYNMYPPNKEKGGCIKKTKIIIISQY